jgi:hypothetical protein
MKPERQSAKKTARKQLAKRRKAMKISRNAEMPIIVHLLLCRFRTTFLYLAAIKNATI